MNKKNIWFETKRLKIFHPSISDYEDYLSLLKNEKVTKYTYKYNDDAQVQNDLDKVLEHYKKHKFSVGIIRLNHSLEFIGRAGLFYNKFENEMHLTLVYLLLPQFWGKGYGTEIVNGLINYTFYDLNLNKILVLIHEKNLPSQYLLKKFNPLFVKKINHSNMIFNQYIIYKNKTVLNLIYSLNDKQ